jgi:hypothetical protein
VLPRSATATDSGVRPGSASRRIARGAEIGWYTSGGGANRDPASEAGRAGSGCTIGPGGASKPGATGKALASARGSRRSGKTFRTRRCR